MKKLTPIAAIACALVGTQAMSQDMAASDTVAIAPCFIVSADPADFRDAFIAAGWQPAETENDRLRASRLVAPTHTALIRFSRRPEGIEGQIRLLESLTARNLDYTRGFRSGDLYLLGDAAAVVVTAPNDQGMAEARGCLIVAPEIAEVIAHRASEPAPGLSDRATALRMWHDRETNLPGAARTLITHAEFDLPYPTGTFLPAPMAVFVGAVPE